MASLEQRGNRFRVIFRLSGTKHYVSVKAADRNEAEAGLARLEENLRLVERGQLKIRPGPGPTSACSCSPTASSNKPSNSPAPSPTPDGSRFATDSFAPATATA